MVAPNRVLYPAADHFRGWIFLGFSWSIEYIYEWVVSPTPVTHNLLGALAGLVFATPIPNDNSPSLEIHHEKVAPECAAVTCPTQHECIVTNAKPCVPINPSTSPIKPPRLGPGESKCGPSICKRGTNCCNESCGICTKPGKGCILLFCLSPGPNRCKYGEVCCNECCGFCRKAGESWSSERQATSCRSSMPTWPRWYTLSSDDTESTWLSIDPRQNHRDFCVTIRSRKTLFFNVTPDVGRTFYRDFCRDRHQPSPPRSARVFSLGSPAAYETCRRRGAPNGKIGGKGQQAHADLGPRRF